MTRGCDTRVLVATRLLGWKEVLRLVFDIFVARFLCVWGAWYCERIDFSGNQYVVRK